MFWLRRFTLRLAIGNRVQPREAGASCADRRTAAVMDRFRSSGEVRDLVLRDATKQRDVREHAFEQPGVTRTAVAVRLDVSHGKTLLHRRKDGIKVDLRVDLCQAFVGEATTGSEPQPNTSA